jgi:hypothetical protein
MDPVAGGSLLCVQAVNLQEEDENKKNIPDVHTNSICRFM